MAAQALFLCEGLIWCKIGKITQKYFGRLYDSEMA